MNWSQFDQGVFLINVLGVVYDPVKKMILIGLREKDPYLKDLTWSFPGGRPTYEDELEDSLKKQVKLKTGLDIIVKNVFFAKTYPENREFLSVYYYCEVSDGVERAGEKFTEIRWVRPTDVQKYFTTSLHPKVLQYLKGLE